MVVFGKVDASGLLAGVTVMEQQDFSMTGARLHARLGTHKRAVARATARDK